MSMLQTVDAIQSEYRYTPHHNQYKESNPGPHTLSHTATSGAPT